MTMQPTPTELDGRFARSARTRTKIVDAMYALIREGTLIPTAQQVATRADVGIRTVFRHFSDMEQLYRAIDTRLADEIPDSLLSGSSDGDLTEPVPFDLAGEPRFRDDSVSADSGNGDAPIVDMGAFEYQ